MHLRVLRPKFLPTISSQRLGALFWQGVHPRRPSICHCPYSIADHAGRFPIRQFLLVLFYPFSLSIISRGSAGVPETSLTTLVLY